MRKNQHLRHLTLTAILIALGILIPMVMPVKIIIGPASFTLASHVPVFIAMFISPAAAVAVALGTAFGFFLTFPFIIAFRALSHVVFALIGAIILQKRPQIVLSNYRFQFFNVFIGIIHVIVEVAVVSVFYFGGSMSAASYESGFIVTVLLLIGFGGFIHSMIDFTIAFWLSKQLSKQFSLPVFDAAKKVKQLTEDQEIIPNNVNS